MYDIKPLEEDWKKYKAKQRKPFYVLILLVMLFLLIGFFYFSKEINLFNDISKHINSFSQVDQPDTSNIVLLNGSLKRIESYDSSEIEKEESSDILVDIPILDVEDVSTNQDVLSEKKAKVYLDIIETSSVTAYKDVERRFKQSRDIDDALFLAKSYYKKGDFQKSEYWALETNKLNSALEESFLIFVKSKVKLGKKNEAISILNSYLKRTDSPQAKALLNQIYNNEI